MPATPLLKKGDLVEIQRQGTFTVCYSAQGLDFPELRECPVKELEIHTHPRDYYKNIFENLEGKIALIVYVSLNRLKQPVGYRVLIEGNEMFCKSIVAEKYFKLVETQDNESRGFSKVSDS